MEVKSNNILQKELKIKAKNNKSFKLIIIKEKDEIKLEAYILDDICNVQYSTNLNIKQFYKIIKYLKNINLLMNFIQKSLQILKEKK